MGVVEGGCPALNGVVPLQGRHHSQKGNLSIHKIAIPVPVRKHYF